MKARIVKVAASWRKARLIALSWFRDRQSSLSHAGLRTALSTVLLVGATLIFSDVAEDVMSGDSLVDFDRRMMLWFQARQRPVLTQLLSLVSDAHGALAFSIMGALLGLYLLWRREWRWLITLALVLPGGMLTNVLLKQVFHRDRPTLNGAVSLLTDYSFPSGHVTAAALLYGFLAAFLLSKLPTLSHRLIVVICACVLVCLVGLSRIYLGVHYFSDVVAAASGSTAWLVMWLIVLGAFRRG